MTGLPVQRYNYKRTQRVRGMGCGCTLVGVIVVLAGCLALVATGTLTQIVLQAVGAQRIGETDALFAEASPAPTLEVADRAAPARAVIDLGSYGQQVIDASTTGTQITTGTDSTGLPVATATLTEAGLLQLCNQRSRLCAEGEGGVRRVSFDLRPGGAVVYAEIAVGPLWQRVGLVTRIATNGTVDVIGVDIDGTTYDPSALPPILPADLRASITDAIAEVERAGSEIVRLAVLSVGDASYRLREVTVTETALTVVMR